MRVVATILALASAALQVACMASGNTHDLYSGQGGIGADGSADGKPLFDGSLAETIMGLDVAPGEPSPLTDADTCAFQTQRALRYPLDMVVMMDQSLSMTEATGSAGQTKWEAVKEALKQFLADPNSEGLGIGIQYFPLTVKPTSELPQCTMWFQCPEPSYCMPDRCYKKCGSASECGGAECSALGTQEPYCTNIACDSAFYEKPDVEIDLLPGAAQSIIDSMDEHSPSPATPTLPAFLGATQHAQSWLSQHPDHKVVVVVVTDGEPSVCMDNRSSAEVMADCAKVASDALKATPSIQTFVIGVMAPEDDDEGYLNTIAESGGTGTAYMVEPGKDVVGQFAETLQGIRGENFTCEFQLPSIDAGTLDYLKVNVTYTPGGEEPEAIYYVTDLSKCESVAGGWYYDANPSNGTPTRMLLCPQTCDRMSNAKDPKVDIQIGCRTQTRSPA